MIDELIEATADNAGLSDEQARLGLSGALVLIERHADKDKVQELLTAIPGARELAMEGAALTQSRGIVSGLVGRAGGSSGAAMADAMTINQHLARAGINVSDMQEILPIAMTFVQQKTGKDLLRDVLLSIPGLGPLLTGQGG
jgi:hypothetical protein